MDEKVIEILILLFVLSSLFYYITDESDKNIRKENLIKRINEDNLNLDEEISYYYILDRLERNKPKKISSIFIIIPFIFILFFGIYLIFNTF